MVVIRGANVLESDWLEELAEGYGWRYTWAFWDSDIALPIDVCLHTHYKEYCFELL